jgi:HEAT repeat protein
MTEARIEARRLRGPWIALAVASALLAGCATPSGRDAIRARAARGDVASLAALWPKLERETERRDLIRALAPHAAEAKATRVLLEAARPGYTPSLRTEALSALAQADAPEVEPLLVDALGDPLPPVRAAAKAAILARGPTMSPVLERATAVSPNPLVRAASLELLVTEARTEPELRATSRALALQAAEDPAPVVRRAALEGLGRLKVAEARPLIVERLRVDTSRDVRLAAERALEQVGDAEEAPMATVAVLPLRVGGPDPDGRLGRLAARLAEVTRARLSAAEVCEVVDQDRMQAILRELKKRGQLVYDDDALNAPAIGEFKVANQLVYGSVHAEGSLFTVVLKRVDVSTMELVPGAAVTASGYRSELDRLIDETVDRFARGFR